MSDLKRLQQARFMIRFFERMELGTSEWQEVETVIRQLMRAVHIRDDAAIKDAISRLLVVGASRGEGVVGGRDAMPPEKEGDERRELIERTDEPSVSGLPEGLAAELAQTAAALEEAAAEITRVPHIDINGPKPLRPGQSFTVAVYLDKNAARPGETVSELDVHSVQAGEVSVDVWLTATAHFSINAPATQTIRVAPDEDISTVASFGVVVLDPIPAGLDPPALQARFDYRLRASGSVRRDVSIEGQAAPSVLVDKQPVVGVHVHPHESAPDLSVSVVRIDGASYGYRLKIATHHLGGVTAECEWHFMSDPSIYVHELMATFVDDTASPLARSLALRGAGKSFFRDTPETFRDLYWRLVDEGVAPKSMMLNSEERSVPWELMIPERRLIDGTWVTRDPLGVECAVGRWHDTQYSSPGQRIPLQDSLVLAPDYRPPKRLPKAIEERDLVLRLFPGQEVPATFDELDAFYSHNSASLLHFVCHGKDATLQAINLLKREYLTAEQVLGGSVSASCRASRPLVFLNACELGRPGAGLVSVGGFPASFIESGAGGVIAPLWQVDDNVAHEVAVAFYDAVKDEPTTPFAEILRRLRGLGYRDDGRDSFAAYVYYGDPLAAAERGA